MKSRITTIEASQRRKARLLEEAIARGKRELALKRMMTQQPAMTD
jgi:hypothetical protein